MTRWQAEIPQSSGRMRRDVAIDFHDRPYYGTAPQATGCGCAGKPRPGTTRFYRSRDGLRHAPRAVRVTLAVHFVRPTDDTVARLGHAVAAAGAPCAAGPSACSWIRALPAGA
jgi:hypothetical protein